jgi:hypothetical protein
MRPNHDLMERLAAADPLPDAERLSPEEQREADSLLTQLLATPVAPERRPAARPRTRRWALAATASAGVALAAFAAGNLLDSDAPGPDVIELAVAAVSAEDAVYHTVDRRRVEGSDFLPATQTAYFESWHTTDGRLHQKAYASRGERRGRLIGDFAGRRAPGRRGGPAMRWDASTNTIYSNRFGSVTPSRGAPSIDPFGDPGASLRAFEAQGRLRLAGKTRVDGRDAYRLTSGTVEGFAPRTRERVVFMVDADTYLPLSTHFSQRAPDGGRLVLHIRYLVYERLPLNARTLAQLDLDPHPGAKCAPGADETMGRGSLGFPNPCAR